jgi:predicted HicB family RNase H-like nuclease
MSGFIHYKGYIGSVEFSEEDAVFHGKVIGLKALISFEGDTVKNITKDFHNAVDEYLEYCEENSVSPEKPYKGSFNVRIGPELHRKAAVCAKEHGLSLNMFIEKAVANELARI